MSKRKISITIHETIDEENLSCLVTLLGTTMDNLVNEKIEKLDYSIETETFYSFNELSEEAQEQAVIDMVNVMIECLLYEEGTNNYRKAIDEAESMRTPWFVGSYILDYCKEEIVQELIDNEYLFNDKGDCVDWSEN
jgi:hypothetical protein